ncbi:MAG: SDR family oxidoreductase, partial [Actinomycetota bacterium]
MILIAGGTGRLGSALTARLTGQGLPVRILTRDPARAAHLTGHGAETVTGDVRDPASLAVATRGTDTVVSAVHGFAGPGRGSPATVDRDGNINLVNAAREAGAAVVLISVAGAAADSPLELSRMKYAAEQFLQASGAAWTIVRATAFLELWIEILAKTAARSGRPVVFGHGRNPVNFVSVTDVAALAENAITDPAARGRVLEIGGPADLTFNQLAAAVQASAGRTSPPRNVPPAVLRLMAGTIGRLSPEFGRKARAALIMDSVDFTHRATSIRQDYPGLP